MQTTRLCTLAQLPRFLESILISCGLAGVFSDDLGSSHDWREDTLGYM